ncbi:hypothetical protein IQ218_03665 [Synechocystis salina LEGE 06099]|nr:hypothetical protein [Synechocystis salina LEGE 06099]
MQSSQTWAMSSADTATTATKETNWLSLLFFLMGAMNVYVFFRRQRDWLNQQGLRLIKVALASFGCAALLEALIF